MAKINYVEWLRQFEHISKLLFLELLREAYSWEEIFESAEARNAAPLLFDLLPTSVISEWERAKIRKWYQTRKERIDRAFTASTKSPSRPFYANANERWAKASRLKKTLDRQLVKRILAVLKAPGKADTDAEWRIRYLRKICPVGTEITPVVTSVAPSGMSRRMRVFVPVMEEAVDGTKRMRIQEITRLVCFVTRERWNDKHEELSISDCGMDMCFELVYRLATALYGDGRALQYGRV